MPTETYPMLKNFCATFTLILITPILFFGSALAAEKDSNEVKYRQATMQAMGSQFGALAMVFTKRVARPQDLQVHAEALAVTATIAGELFPDGSEGGKALPAIWQEPDEFAAAAQELTDAAAALAAATKSGDNGAIGKAFKAAGSACKGCHKRYKEEDD
jgi:cytochrome c556